MKKESLGWRLFWLLFNFAPKFFVLSFAFVPLKLDMYLHFLITILLAVFLAKIEIDKQDLENKIFELKELIKEKQL